MRFRIGDTVRLKKGHHEKSNLPNDYEIMRIKDNVVDLEDEPRIKLLGFFGWTFRESSLRLVRRAS